MTISFLTGFFVICGSFVFLIGSIGLLRSEDIYCRTSTIATATGLGLGCFTLALVFNDLTLVNCIKAIIAFSINMAVSSVVGMLVGRSAYASDAKMSTKTHKDELAEHHS